MAGVLPHGVEVGGCDATPRESSRAVAEEVTRRQQPDAPDGPEVYLFIHDLPRFRDLRRREDDFSFSRREEEASPADNLARSSAKGLGLGRPRPDLVRQPEQPQPRVQPPGAPRVRDAGPVPDESERLRPPPRRPSRQQARSAPGLVPSEEQNRLEKFRPYGLPAEDWLDRIGDQLRKRDAVVEGS